MKPLLPLLCLTALVITLCSCPYDSPYNLTEVPLQTIDENLLGKWATMVAKPGNDKQHKEEPVKVIFEKRTAMEYDVSITGYIDELKPWNVISNDSIKGTAYLSAVAGKQFINMFVKGRVYIAEIIKDSTLLSIMPLVEHFTSKHIQNSSELREAVEYHYKVRLKPGYDPAFALRNLQRVN